MNCLPVSCLRSALSASLLALSLSGIQAQDNGAAPNPANNTTITGQAINYRERPRYPFDPQRLKRRPMVDGKIAENEWDPLYTIGEGAVKGTVYVNWDDDFLYLAVKTDQPAWLAFDFDCNADGWLRGADNLELTVSPPTDDGSITLAARILDAAGNKDAPVWNEKVVDTRSILAVEKGAAGSYVLEMAIPKGIAGLNPRSGATIAFRADLLPALSQPNMTPPYEPHLLVDMTLVEARTISAPGITPRLTLEDNRLVPGQPLRANLELMNQSEAEVGVKSITWRGNTGADDLLRAERDPNVPAIKGLKTLKRGYRSVLPDTAIPGFYQITVTAELDNGKTVQSTASFSVVEAFNLAINPEPDPINVVGPTAVKLFVEIASAVPGFARGDVEIEVPAGWEVKGKKRKDFYIGREDSTGRFPFYVTLPSNTQSGDYIVNATVYWKNKTWKAHRTIHINHASAPELPKAEPVKKP